MAYHKPTNLTFQVKVPQTITCRTLNIQDMLDCSSVLEETELKGVFSPAIYEYFNKGFLGFGAYAGDQMVGYVFIKNPKERPETLSVVRKKWRGLGIATALRNWAISQAAKELVGEYIYSATEAWNFESLKSLLESGYEITGLAGEPGKQIIQLRRKLKL